MPKSSIQLDSEFLTTAEKINVYKLCEFDASDRFECVYNGRRDGFTNEDFHVKCDNVSPTLTIVKSDKSFICGGFTKIAWETVEPSNPPVFNSDEDAFIFSLVNHEKTPLKMKCSKPENAIGFWRTNDPTFGVGDFYVNGANGTLNLAGRGEELSWWK